MPRKSSHHQASKRSASSRRRLTSGWLEKSRYLRGKDGVTLKRLNIYFPDEVAMWLRVHCKMTERSVGDFLTELANEYRARVER